MDKRIGPEAFHLYKHSIRLDTTDAGALYAAKFRGLVRYRAPEPAWGSSRPPGPAGLSVARIQVCPILLIYSLWQLRSSIALPSCIGIVFHMHVVYIHECIAVQGRNADNCTCLSCGACFPQLWPCN